MKQVILTAKLAVLTLLFGTALSFATVSAAPTTSGSKQSVCKGAGLSDAECDGTGANGLDKVIKAVLQVLSAVVGVIAVIMIIISGLRYITSGGDAAKVGAAKNALIYAIVGLVIVALAQVIVHFVVAKAT